MLVVVVLLTFVHLLAKDRHDAACTPTWSPPMPSRSASA